MVRIFLIDLDNIEQADMNNIWVDHRVTLGSARLSMIQPQLLSCAQQAVTKNVCGSPPNHVLDDRAGGGS